MRDKARTQAMLNGIPEWTPEDEARLDELQERQEAHRLAKRAVVERAVERMFEREDPEFTTVVDRLIDNAVYVREALQVLLGEEVQP